MDTGLGYYAVFRPGEEQADYFCKHCFSRLSKNETYSSWGDARESTKDGSSFVEQNDQYVCAC